MEIFRHFPYFGGWTEGMLRRCDTFIYTEGRAMLWLDQYPLFQRVVTSLSFNLDTDMVHPPFYKTVNISTSIISYSIKNSSNSSKNKSVYQIIRQTIFNYNFIYRKAISKSFKKKRHNLWVESYRLIELKILFKKGLELIFGAWTETRRFRDDDCAGFLSRCGGVSRRWLANPWGQWQRVAEAKGAVFPRNQYQCRLASLLAVLTRRPREILQTPAATPRIFLLVVTARRRPLLSAFVVASLSWRCLSTLFPLLAK